MLSLIKPNPALKNAFLSMILEYRAVQEFTGYHDLAMLDFNNYLMKMEENESMLHLHPGQVAQTTFWMVADSNTIIGESRLRHTLTPELEIEGGNIGYSIRPSMRLKGYGTSILRLTLIEAQSRGFSQVLLTCDRDNLGSKKIILANGGKFDGESISPESHQWVQRFWIPLT